MLVMVPIVSRPMFMPDETRAAGVMSSTFETSSSRAEAMDMETSMTAPSAPMLTETNNKPRISIGKDSAMLIR